MESLNEMQTALARRLSPEQSATFVALARDNDRVFFAYNHLQAEKLFPENVRVFKCDLKSEERRNYGNHVFVRLKKNREAIKHYNKAVAYATSSDKLSLAYGNRSAVYFQNEMFEECVRDINIALNFVERDDLRDKLNKRKIRAREARPNLPEPYFTELPELEKNPEITCATNSIKINSSEKYGRFVVATRDITSGDIIAAERPYATVLLREYYLSHCHECLEPGTNLIPCLKCPLSLYCSEKCRANAWTQYHKYECPILDTLHAINATKLQLLALKIVLKQRGDIEDEALDFPLDPAVYKSENYAEIHHLCTNQAARNAADLLTRATTAAIFLRLLEGTTFFDACEDRALARENTAALLLRHLQTAPSNMHEISEMQGGQPGKKGYDITEIGAGAYAFLSLLNHSCSPNVVRSCHGTLMVLRAIKTIKVGEQLYDNYGYHYALMEREQRKAHLQDQYLFECECEACLNDYPLYKVVSKGHTNFLLTQAELQDLVRAKRSTAHEILPRLIKNTKKFEENPDENVVEIMDNQELMKQCFAILANKNTLL